MIEIGQCYCRRNPLWGRDVVKVNRQVKSSVLDFERYDVTLIRTTGGLQLVEHEILPLTVFQHTGFVPVSEQLFLKLHAMARMQRAAQAAHPSQTPQSSLLVETLLRQYGVIDDTPPEVFAQQYAQGTKALLTGVYDVVDVHK